MTEKSFNQRYMEAKAACDKNIAIVKPFLQQFSAKHDAGSRFYEDITILYGPGVSEYMYVRDKQNYLFNRWRKGTVGMFNVKWAGGAFILDYEQSKSYFVYKGNMQPVQWDIAIAIRDLYDAQEYFAALHGVILEDRAKIVRDTYRQKQK